MILSFFGFSWSFFLAPTEPLGGLEMWWSETHVVSQLAAVGRTVAGAVGRCWGMLGDAGRCWEMLGDAGRLEVLVFPIFVQVGQHRRASDAV